MKPIYALTFAAVLGLSLASVAQAQSVLPGFAMPEAATSAPVAVHRNGTASQFRAEAPDRAAATQPELDAFPGRDR